MKIVLYSKQECLSISVEEHNKHNLTPNPWDLLFGLPDEVFTEEPQKVTLENVGQYYLTESEWAIPSFFVKEVVYD